MSQPTPPTGGPSSGAGPNDAAEDRALLARHASGDRDAFAELVRRHRDRLWRVALRTLGNAEDAADALQDALLSAYRAAGGFRGEAAVTTWLHRIVVNSCLDLARRRTARPTVPLDESTADDRAAPDELGARETAGEVLAALRRLPPEQAAAIVLVDIEGYPVADVAEMLEVPVGTVKSRCARGRARLAETLHHLDQR
ncbi:MAG: polymerase sigma-70 factor, subfamily, partial [Actinomycetota bacterium]|nr:polymerase sigma-70 factor, subfamily [Actinomycetota bacterium]